MIMKLKILFSLVMVSLFLQVSSSISPTCHLCHEIVTTIQKTVSIRAQMPLIQDIAYEYCSLNHVQANQVCSGSIKEMTRYIVEGLWRHQTNPHSVCQNLRMCKNQYVNRVLQDDVKNTIKLKPNKTWQKATGRRTLKILHISDLHPDLFYTQGASANCTQPVCCRINSTAKDNGTKKAGYWGTLGPCDLPIQTFDVFLNQVSKIQLDAVFWTGDNTPHDIWQQTQSYNLNYSIILAQKIREKLNFTVVPAMGNHQSWPVNVYDHRTDREQVLNGGLAEAWKHWLDQKAIKMQREKGYYSMIYPKMNNLKILSINTQAGNNLNFFLLQDPSDPGDMLAWIQKELGQSQKNNQTVFIIGHIPPNNDNLNDWAMRYNALMDRYSYVVRGQFFGHTHTDHFSFIPEMKNLTNISFSKISSYYLVTPSLTTHSGHLPRYRVMQVDYDTLQVVDYAEYRLDIRKFQTKNSMPFFQLFYRFKNSYKIEDMTPEGGMTSLRNKLRDDPEVQKLYTRNKCGGLCAGTNGTAVFCQTTSAPQFLAQCNNKTFTKTPFEKAAGPWRFWKHK